MIEVISTGIYTTLQDQGRFGYRNYGVPISGPMDLISARNANRILNNEPNAALLEFMLQGAVLKFNQAATIAITGATDSPTLNDEKIAVNIPIKVQVNDCLKVGRCSAGSFGYLAIMGGFLGEKILNSLAHYKGITSNQRILKGEILKFNSQSFQALSISNKIELIDFNTQEIFASKGPDYDTIDPKTVKNLLNSSFTVSNEINRMGYRIDAQTPLEAAEILTAPVQPGTVQLTPSGKLIVLMADCQTTGGYARILQLSAKSRSILAQKRTGSIFRFKFFD
ncbi:MAG: allophanate hydrolase subunit 2 family protein [Crocinitomix sp.]|nr:allophanate hydrolase subunit 2 family protein [Crocinitomix sp.]